MADQLCAVTDGIDTVGKLRAAIDALPEDLPVADPMGAGLLLQLCREDLGEGISREYLTIA